MNGPEWELFLQVQNCELCIEQEKRSVAQSHQQIAKQYLILPDITSVNECCGLAFCNFYWNPGLYHFNLHQQYPSVPFSFSSFIQGWLLKYVAFLSERYEWNKAVHNLSPLWHHSPCRHFQKPLFGGTCQKGPAPVDIGPCPMVLALAGKGLINRCSVRVFPKDSIIAWQLLSSEQRLVYWHDISTIASAFPM